MINVPDRSLEKIETVILCLMIFSESHANVEKCGGASETHR